MTEDEAQAWIAKWYGAAGVAKMTELIALVTDEAMRQNLIAPSTLPSIWTRHIVDSAQLLRFAAVGSGHWLDIGTGAGFPGLVVATLSDRPVTLVEPRKRRAHFLEECAIALGISERVTIVCDRVQALEGIAAAVISARAVAPLTDLFAWASGCATPQSRWILPKGRSAREEVDTARRTWHGVFHVEHSISDPDSLIVVASGVRRR